MHFYVYKHVFILKENRKITRFFLTLRDSDKNIVAFTNFHIFIKSGKNRKSKFKKIFFGKTIVKFKNKIKL